MATMELDVTLDTEAVPRIGAIVLARKARAGIVRRRRGTPGIARRASGYEQAQ
jgi:hypothetical protein